VESFLRLKGRISDPDFPGFDKSVHARGILDQGLHRLFIMEVRRCFCVA
jgi:hypothetical protein